MYKTYHNSFARYGGFAAVVLEWLAVALFYALKPELFNGKNPISSFAAVPETKLIFSLNLSIAALSFWIFIKYHLSKIYTVPVKLFSFSMFTYALVAFTPFNPNNSLSNTIHQSLALLFSVSCLGGMYLIGRLNRADKQLRLWSYSAVAASTFLMICYILTPKESSFILPFEASSVFATQAWVIWISLRSFHLKTN